MISKRRAELLEVLKDAVAEKRALAFKVPGASSLEMIVQAPLVEEAMARLMQMPRADRRELLAKVRTAIKRAIPLLI